MKRSLFFLLIITVGLVTWAQDILTADQFFSQVAERYAQVTDYEAKLGITAGKTEMHGTVAYRSPSLLRIDFSQPADQVIVFDGETVVVYLPEYNAVLSQSASSSEGGAGAAGLNSSEGLKMMRRNYTVAFETGPDPVPIDEGSTEMVVRLVLSRKTVAEGFKTLTLSIAPDSKLIRRIEGVNLSNELFVFDFSDIKLNQGIPEARFIYDSPASANVYNNFLFSSDN